MNLNLQGKLALVTGSTKGIGFAIAALLAEEGARVIVNGRTEPAVRDAVAAIRRKAPQAQLEAFAGDLSTAEAAVALRGGIPKSRSWSTTSESSNPSRSSRSPTRSGAGSSRSMSFRACACAEPIWTA